MGRESPNGQPTGVEISKLLLGVCLCVCVCVCVVCDEFGKIRKSECLRIILMNTGSS